MTGSARRLAIGKHGLEIALLSARGGGSGVVAIGVDKMFTSGADRPLYNRMAGTQAGHGFSCPHSHGDIWQESLDNPFPE
jgi:hypothetical protein